MQWTQAIILAITNAKFSYAGSLIFFISTIQRNIFELRIPDYVTLTQGKLDCCYSSEFYVRNRIRSTYVCSSDVARVL